MNKVFLTSFFIIFLVASCSIKSRSICPQWKYPRIVTDTVRNVYYGRKVVDPYRNMENQKDTNVQTWYRKESVFCDSVLNHISGRDTLLKEVKKLAYSSNIHGDLPIPADSKIFFYRSFTKEKIEKLYYSDIAAKHLVELFSTKDLNKKTHSHYTIEYLMPSYSGKYVAFALSSNGNEKSTIRIIDVKKKMLLPECIPWAMGGNPEWLPDESGFFYWQARNTDIEKGNANKLYEEARIRLHIVGTDSRTDREIFSMKATPQISFTKIDLPRFYVFPTSQYVLASINHGTSQYSEVFYASLKDVLKKPANKIPWKNVFTKKDKAITYTLRGHDLYVLAYNVNPNGALEKIDLKHPDKKEILFEKKNTVLSDMIQNKKAIYFTTSTNGLDSLYMIDSLADSIINIPLPISGTLDLTPDAGVSARYVNNDNLLLGLNSWDKKWGVYYYNPNTGLTKRSNSCPPGRYGARQDLIVKELEVPSYDGVLVPFTLVYRKGLKLNGENPVMLFAYGAYGFPVPPNFHETRYAWWNQGGIYAIAHVRGGGEKGDAWYKGGYKATKPNSWKDYIACAEYLIKHKYTTPGKLAALGASAGGITIGRAITERPELFKAAIILVGTVNVIRLEDSKNTVNVSEFGTVKDSLDFKYLYNMDVYHHIKEGIKYPSILFTAGLNDQRVDAWEPGKVVATMQTLPNQCNTILFRVSNEGHFGGSDEESEITDDYIFLFWQLGVPGFTLNCE